MEPQREAVVEITQNTWATMLELETEPCPGEDAEVDVHAEIGIRGAWEGTVAVAMPLALARDVASVMLACEPDEASAEEIDDVVGELVNVVAGGVKATLEGSNSMGLPEVTRGSSLPAASGNEQTLCFGCAGKRFVVRVAGERTPEGASEPT